MFKKCLVAVLLLCVSWDANACDVCGGSGTGAYLGLMPQFQRNLIGLRLQTQQFVTAATHAEEATDSYQRYELFGAYYVTKNIQLIGILPYQMNHRTEGPLSTDLSGMGDFTLIANYNFKAFNTGKKFTHRFQLGGGFVLPTGKHDEEAGRLRNFQLGRNSFDYLFNLQYYLSFGKWQLNQQFVYRLNSIHEAEYQYGNELNESLQLAYNFSNFDVKWIPYAGINYEYAAYDLESSKRKSDTASEVLFFSYGLQVFKNNWTTGIEIRTPLSQEIAEGQIETNSRLTFNLSYLF